MGVAKTHRSFYSNSTLRESEAEVAAAAGILDESTEDALFVRVVFIAVVVLVVVHMFMVL